MQLSSGIEQLCTFSGQNACSITRHQNAGQDVFEFPRKVFGFETFIELLDLVYVELIGPAVDGEHTRRFANTQHLSPRQFPVDVTCQRGQVADIFDMRFPVQDRLVEMGNTPALGNVELEQVCEFLGCLSGHSIAPGTEWDE